MKEEPFDREADDKANAEKETLAKDAMMKAKETIVAAKLLDMIKQDKSTGLGGVKENAEILKAYDGDVAKYEVHHAIKEYVAPVSAEVTGVLKKLQDNLRSGYKPEYEAKKDDK